MKIYNLLIKITFFFFLLSSTNAQEALPSANAGSFGKYIDQPVSHFTGTSSVSVPIASLSDGNLSTSVSLSYHTGGIRVSEIPSAVGLGWTNVSGGSITRTVRGVKDDQNFGGNGYWHKGAELSESTNHVEEVADSERDGEPDIFTYAFAGHQGKFFFDDNNDIHMVPKSDLKVEQKFYSNHFSGFIVTDTDGTKYYFGYCYQDDWQNPVFDNSTEFQRVEGQANLAISWNLERIESFDKKHFIHFDYTRDYYKYKFLGDCQKYSAEVSGTVEYEGDCDMQEIEVDMEGSLIQKITTPTKEVTFLYNTRVDLRKHSNFTQNPRKLYRINVEQDTFCQQFKLSHTYFLDDSGTGPDYKRLRLNNVKKLPCFGPFTNYTKEQPWIFEYNGTFFPKYLSKKIDHWGYYNGTYINEDLDNIVPLGSCYDDQCYGSAIRTTNESQMIKGTLKKVTYPTKGSVTFDYEANTYSEDATSTQELLNKSSCSGLAACCDENSRDQNLVVTQEIIDNGFYELHLVQFFGPPGSCYDTTVFSSKIEIFDETTGGNLVHTNSFNVTVPGWNFHSVTVPMNTITTLVAGHNYKFKISSVNGQGRVIVSLPQDFINVKCGGLRIKKTTLHDGISGANDIIKTFNYDQHDEPGRSSGILSGIPTYAHQAFWANGITTVVYNSTSVKPLNSLEGYHIAYENVTENHNGNGSQKYTFLEEYLPPAVGYPIVPTPAKVYQGKLFIAEVLDDQGNVESYKSVLRNYADSYVNAPGLVYKAAKIRAKESAGTSWTDRYVHKTYNNRTSVYRPSKITNILDGVGSIEDIFYESSAVLGSTKVTSTNSDGKSFELRTTYTADYETDLKDVFEAYNMIGIPYKTEKYVEGILVDGSKTIYSNFTAVGIKTTSTSSNYYPRPYNFQRYEITWSNGVLQNGSWEIKNYFNQYNDKGLIAYYKKEGWTTPKYFYYNSDKQLDRTSFGGHINTFTYYPNTALLKQKTNVDGTTMSYTYDGLSRLSTSINDCENIKKSYDYFNTAALSSLKNSIEVTTDYLAYPNSQVDTVITKTYFDGLGRDIQVVYKNQAPDGVHDMLDTKAYDNQGRVKYLYKKIESTHSNGAYISPQPSWLKTENHYYASSLNRIEWTQPPNWHKTEYEYSTNTVVDDIRIDGTNSNYYTTNVLFKTTKIDPDGKKLITFKDKQSRVIQRRKVSSSGNNSLNITTVYDNKNRPTHILPPGVETTAGPYNDLIFKYQYNGEDQLISKKIPGANTIEFTYNEKDLINSYRDAHLAYNNKWYGYQYDYLGRLTREGFYNSQPTGSIPDELLKVSIYGNLSHNKDKKIREKAKVLGTSSWITKDYTYNTCGELTNTNANHHLNGSLNSITSVFSYDGANNLTKSITNVSAFAKSNEITNTQTYDHAGRGISNFFQVDATGPNVQISENSYDSENELQWIKQGFSNGNVLQKIDFEYRDHGPLSKINSSTLQGSEQAWDICTEPSLLDPGSNIDDKDLFYMELHHDNTIPDVATATQKNGNISAIQSQVKGRAQSINSYVYDDYNRLIKSVYAERNDGIIDASAAGRFSTLYQYDERGNITSIEREGMYDADGCIDQGQIDKLVLLYYPQSNKLRNVYDQAPAVSKDEGFQNLNNLEYLHDTNGNVTTHQDKGINISYNHLDLPTSIDFINNSNKVEFLYDANGNILQRKSISGSIVLETRDYIAGVEYVNGVIESIAHSQGRVFYSNGGNPRYEYNIIDHLGNTRLVYSDLNGDGKIGDETEILWEGHYYPYGMVMNGPWMDKPESESNYKYNGIEKIEDFDLNLSTARFRTLDPSIGRWLQVDPKLENLYGMSPFCAMNNNPITFNDPNGDIAPLLAVGIFLGGGVLNLATNWGSVNSFGEGLKYFVTGGAGYTVATVNPVLGGVILAGGNLSVQAIHGDLPQINGFSDLLGVATTTALDFLGPYTAGSSIISSWSSFRPTGYLSKADLAILSKEGITPTITEIAGTGLRQSSQVVKNTVVQTANQTVKFSSKRLSQNLVKAGVNKPVNTAAHHIVAGGSKNSYAQLSRDIIKKAGIGIDDATNGVFLPKNLSVANPPAITHSTLHTKTYFKNVYERISRVPLSEVKNQIGIIRTQLLNGTFPF